MVEKEEEKAEEEKVMHLTFGDVACARLWSELTSSSSSSSSSSSLIAGRASPPTSSTSSSSSSFLSLGVPWYRLAAALQHQLKEMLLRESGGGLDASLDR